MHRQDAIKTLRRYRAQSVISACAVAIAATIEHDTPERQVIAFAVVLLALLSTAEARAEMVGVVIVAAASGIFDEVESRLDRLDGERGEE